MVDVGITTGLVGAYFFYVKTKLLFLSRYSFSIRIVVITIAGGYMDIGYNLIEKIYGDVVIRPDLDGSEGRLAGTMETGPSGPVSMWKYSTRPGIRKLG